MSKGGISLANVFLVVFVLAVFGLVVSFIGWPYYPFLTHVLGLSQMTLIVLVPIGIIILFNSSQVSENSRDEELDVPLPARDDLPKSAPSPRNAKPRVLLLVLMCMLACGALLVRIIVFNLG